MIRERETGFGLTMKKYTYSLAFLLLLVVLGSARVYAQPLQILVSPIPPLVMKDKDVSHGLLWDMAEILAERLHKKHGLDVREKPLMLPWTRAYKDITSRSDRLMLQMSRSPEREDLFEWITQTTHLSFAFVTSVLPVLDTLEEARKVQTIVVYRGSRLEKFLRSNGFNKTLVLANNSENSARLLDAGRVKAWYASVDEVLWLHKNAVMKKKPLIGKPVLSVPVWAVGSRGMPSETQAMVRSELELMKTDGTLSRLLETYGLSS